MRNLFDQYNSPENRLTHALATCLQEDRALLRRFLKWIGVRAPVSETKLLLAEQSLPGDPPRSEEDADRNGLPDIVIHDGGTWCLLIESKVQAPLLVDQLDRHEKTLRRRGFGYIERVVLTKANVKPRRAICLTWAGLYAWLGTSAVRSHWAGQLRSYLRIAEVRLAREEYLTEGTLTMFDGFQFSNENPYTYGEGKRHLKLAMVELRKDRRLKKLGMDPKAPGRSAITGRGQKSVWDFLPLVHRPHGGLFTSYPHLTLAVLSDYLEVAVTVPNGVPGPVRNRLVNLGIDGLVKLNMRIVKNAGPILSRGGSVHAYALQRHYTGQRAPAIIDAKVEFKLETCNPRRDGADIKRQPEWLILFAELLRKKQANIQFGYAVHLPWTTKGLNSRESLTIIADSWLSLKPLIDVIRNAEEE